MMLPTNPATAAQPIRAECRMLRIPNDGANQSYIKAWFSMIMVSRLRSEYPTGQPGMTAAHGIVKSKRLA